MGYHVLWKNFYSYYVLKFFFEDLQYIPYTNVSLFHYLKHRYTT